MENAVKNKVAFVANSKGARIPMRSRLEARWAVFFNWCGLTWEYEPKSFKLQSGHSYTPDFWVSGVGWFEIKPNEEKLYDSRSKILEFCDSASQLLEAEADKRYFVAVGHGPLIGNIHIGYFPDSKAGLRHCLWRASNQRPISFSTFVDKIIPLAEQAAADWAQNEVTLGEFEFRFYHDEVGVKFPSLLKVHNGKQPLQLNSEELKTVSQLKEQKFR